MTSEKSIYLGGVIIPYPNEFYIMTFNIERSDRTASGRLVKDIVTVKRQFTLRYRNLSGSEMALFSSLKAKNEFLVLKWYENDEQKSAVVWLNELPGSMVTIVPEEWEDVTIELEER